MALKKLRCFNSGTISAGSYWEKQFAPPEDWRIKHIWLSERSGANLYNAQIYIKLGDDLITDDFAPARHFHLESRNPVEVGRDVPKGTNIYVKVTNNESSDINVDLCFELEE